jgi:hypothetical protein
LRVRTSVQTWRQIFTSYAKGQTRPCDHSSSGSRRCATPFPIFLLRQSVWPSGRGFRMLRCWRTWQLVTLGMSRSCSASLTNVPGQPRGGPGTLVLSLRLRVQLPLVLHTRGRKRRLRRKRVANCRARVALLPLLPATMGNLQTSATYGGIRECQALVSSSRDCREIKRLVERVQQLQRQGNTPLQAPRSLDGRDEELDYQDPACPSTSNAPQPLGRATQQLQQQEW